MLTRTLRARAPSRVVALCLLIMAETAHGANSALPTSRCQQLGFEGTVQSGETYRQAIGGGLEFELHPDGPPFSGWEIRIVPTNSLSAYPDYAMVATPPYQSVNPLLINTAYGMRAQDAVAWNPRSFQWIASPSEYRRATDAYFSYLEPHGPHATRDGKAAEAFLVGLPDKSATGTLQIEDVRLAPGRSDQSRQAAGVARLSIRAAHTLEPLAMGDSPLAGGLHWLRFKVTFGVDGTWKAPAGVQSDNSQCGH